MEDFEALRGKHLLITGGAGMLGSTIAHLTLQVSVRPKVVFASSRFVYGRTDYSPVDENHPFNCLSIYGIHKLAGEKYHRFYCEAYGVPTVVLRIPNPYGPRQQMRHSKYGIANWFIRMAFGRLAAQALVRRNRRLRGGHPASLHGHWMEADGVAAGRHPEDDRLLPGSPQVLLVIADR